MFCTFISPPVSNSLQSGLMFYCRFFLSTPDNRDALAIWHEILHGDQHWPNFIMVVQTFGGPTSPPQKKNRGQKHAKFGPILDDFEVRWQISPDGMKIFKIRLGHFVLRFLLHWVNKVW